LEKGFESKADRQASDDDAKASEHPTILLNGTTRISGWMEIMVALEVLALY
jgi:hypothetical protein